MPRSDGIVVQRSVVFVAARTPPPIGTRASEAAGPSISVFAIQRSSQAGSHQLAEPMSFIVAEALAGTLAGEGEKAATETD